MADAGSSLPSSAVVLLSAGLDSTFNLLQALKSFPVRLALTFNYGQKAARQEIERSRILTQCYKVAHQVIDLPWFSDFTHTSLVGSAEIPRGAEVSIDDLSRSQDTAKRVWVPNRNGILLNVAAGFAEGLGASHVIPGFNLEEAQTFPDNSSGFLQSLDASWLYSTNGKVKSHCFSIALDKSEMVRQGIALNMPFGDLWPCYLAGAKWCGECESCQRFRRALAANALSFDELR
jgi:7-cyano-7-deazaguanine synthase